jgi:hypothetical protein
LTRGPTDVSAYVASTKRSLGASEAGTYLDLELLTCIVPRQLAVNSSTVRLPSGLVNIDVIVRLIFLEPVRSHNHTS